MPTASGPTSHIANQDVSRSFEGHCALTNADEANEVQQNVVTAKKGKKRGIKAILHRFR